jgi:hypothetical protein
MQPAGCVTEMLQDVSVPRIVGLGVNNSKYIVMMLSITKRYQFRNTSNESQGAALLR